MLCCSVSNLSVSSSGFPGSVSPGAVSGLGGAEDKQCRYPGPVTNNNMGGGGGQPQAVDPVMNYAASLATATSPGTNIAAAAHFYQQQVTPHRTAALLLPSRAANEPSRSLEFCNHYAKWMLTPWYK